MLMCSMKVLVTTSLVSLSGYLFWIQLPKYGLIFCCRQVFLLVSALSVCRRSAKLAVSVADEHRQEHRQQHQIIENASQNLDAVYN